MAGTGLQLKQLSTFQVADRDREVGPGSCDHRHRLR
jgi:hypothetical protein